MATKKKTPFEIECDNTRLLRDAFLKYVAGCGFSLEDSQQMTIALKEWCVKERLQYADTRDSFDQLNMLNRLGF